MGEVTAISWCDHTFNPWIGCMKVSPACDGCYAEARMDTRFGQVAWGAPGKGVGERRRTVASTWAKPLKWNREQAAVVANWQFGLENGVETPRPARFVFCASLADVFDNAVPVAWRRDLFELIHATPNLTWLLLTKRPQNIVKLFKQAGSRDFSRPGGGSIDWPHNAAIGCTVVTQEEADRDVPALLAAKAALKPAFAFLSMEPLLGPVDLRPWLGTVHHHPDNDQASPAVQAIVRAAKAHLGVQGLDWIITGGETDQGKHKARPSHPDWLRSLRDQCAATGVAYHHKQNGEWSPVYPAGFGGPSAMLEVPREGWDGCVWKVGKARAGRRLDGVEHNARPAIQP